MQILLSTIGSRGDVQPLVALGLQLKALGQDVHMCVPPDFRAWIEGFGMTVTPIGPELRSTGKTNPMATRPSPEQNSSADGRHGRRAVRNDHSRRSGL